MRTTIKAYLSLNLGRIPPLTSELVALEGLKKTSYNLVSTLAPSFLFGQWIFILVMTCWLSGERSLPFGLLVNWIFFILTGIQDMHESLDEFEFRLICIRVTALD